MRVHTEVLALALTLAASTDTGTAACSGWGTDTGTRVRVRVPGSHIVLGCVSVMSRGLGGLSVSTAPQPGGAAQSMNP